jgi:hypothetical protein
MPSATIDVQYVNDPRPGMKSGSVKTRDGVYYGVKPAMLGLFKPNNHYEIQYESMVSKGKTYHNVVSVKPAAEQAGGGAPAPRSSGGYQTDDKTAERIFVCGAINAAISSNQLVVQTTDLIQAVNSLRDAWRQTLGKKQTAIEEEIEDQVPY